MTHPVLLLELVTVCAAKVIKDHVLWQWAISNWQLATGKMDSNW